METPTKDPLLVARSRVARASKRDSTDDIIEARRELSAVRAERAIRRAITDEPAITSAQRANLASLLFGGGERS